MARERPRWLPARILKYRRPVEQRIYTRMYGRYENRKGQVKGFSFQVKISPRLRGKVMALHIRHIIGKMLYEHILPTHRKGESFGSFRELYRSQWVRIRKVLDYDVKMKYR